MLDSPWLMQMLRIESKVGTRAGASWGVRLSSEGARPTAWDRCYGVKHDGEIRQVTALRRAIGVWQLPRVGGIPSRHV